MSRAAISPPVHDSATATLSRPSSEPRHLIVDRRAVVGEQRVGVPRPHAVLERAVDVRAPTARTPSTISISPRRRQVVISRRSSGTPSASIVRSVPGDLGLGDPEQAQDPLLEAARAGERGAARRRWPGPSPTSAAARPAAPAARARSAPATGTVGRRHDEPRRGADRLEDRRTLRHHRLLAVARPDRLLVEVAPAAAQPLQDPSRCAARAPGRAPSRAPRRRPTTSAVRSSAVGPRPPLVMIRSTPSRGQEVEGCAQVVAAVRDDHDVRELDAAPAQLLGQPRAVAVRDDAGQDLGAGDDDAGARAHAQVAAARGSCARRALASASVRRPRVVIS